MYVTIQAQDFWCYSIDQPHFSHFCNISMYVFFVTHLPEDDHMIGRNV